VRTEAVPAEGEEPVSDSRHHRPLRPQNTSFTFEQATPFCPRQNSFERACLRVVKSLKLGKPAHTSSPRCNGSSAAPTAPPLPRPVESLTARRRRGSSRRGCCHVGGVPSLRPRLGGAGRSRQLERDRNEGAALRMPEHHTASAPVHPGFAVKLD